jgi:hypothetical protein
MPRWPSAAVGCQSLREDGMGFVTKDELSQLIPAEILPYTIPIPTQIVSSRRLEGPTG